MGVQPRKDSHFHSGRVQVLLCCACVKPPQSSSGHSESAGSDPDGPDQTQQPPPPLRTSQKAPNEPDAGTRCNTTTTHTQSLGAMPPHTQRSHSVHSNSLSFRSGRPRMSSFPRAATTKPTKPANSTNFRIPKQILQIPRIFEVSRFRCGGARERRHPERKDSDFRGVALPSIALRVSRKVRAPRRRRQAPGPPTHAVTRYGQHSTYSVRA